MLTPSDAELVALSEAGPLVRFASELNKDVDPALPLAIAEARLAVENKTWSPQVSQQFWTAFHSLCRLIQPVTMDCLAARHRNIDSVSLIPFKKKKQVSLAERSSRRYLWLLFSLIAISLPLQLYVWIGTIESKKIDDNLSQTQAASTSLTAIYLKLSSDTRSSKHAWTADELNRLDKLIQGTTSLNVDLDRLLYEASILKRMSGGSLDVTALRANEAARDDKDKWWKGADAVSERVHKIRLVVINTQEAASLLIGVILSFILPLLFGTIGAVAYVIRQISNQIMDSTFSQTSPVRHLMRATLGALAGVVVGLFSNLSNQLSLPPLALAFLAGYGVEGLFSMFDGLVAKFKQEAPAKPA